MKAFTRIFMIVALAVATLPVLGQGVGINGSGSSPDASAGLDVDFSDRGMLIPRLTQAQRDAISNPAEGLQVYNTDTQCFNFFNGATWRQSCYECDFNPPTVGNNGPICEGSTLNLTATTVIGATYSWTGPNGFSSSSQNPSISNITAAGGGVYSLVASVNGCSSNPVTTVVTINATPNPPVLGSNSPLCPGDTLQLTASSVVGAVYNWTGPNGFSASSQNASLNTVSTSNSGSYNVIITVNGCASPSVSTSVTVNAAPTANAGADDSVCDGSSISLTASGGVSYVWSTGATTATTSVSPTSLTTYTVTVTDGNGCTASDGVQISIDALPPADAGSDVISSSGANVNLTATGGVSYSWSTGGMTQSISVSPTATTTYTVTVTGSNGCTASDSVTVSIPYEFTSCGQSFQSGPSQSQCNSAYSGTGLAGQVTVTSGIQYWTVPATGNYRIEVWGARSGWDNSGSISSTGLGARMRGDFSLTAGTVLKILVGQVGVNNSSSSSSAGGGGTFVTTNTNTPLIIAGGGGGCEGLSTALANQHGTTSTTGQMGGGTCLNWQGGTGGNGATDHDGGNHGGGGAGLLTDGAGAGSTSMATPARAFVNGGLGGFGLNNNIHGGFGGGGGAWGNGGGAAGGGGYSGGASGDNCGGATAGGGGSYNNGTNQSNSGGVNNTNGKVSIAFLGI